MKPTKYDQQFDTALASFPNIPRIVMVTIAQNESSMNHEAKPFFEKTWRYFTNPNGTPLPVTKGMTLDVQAEALAKLGKEEFVFQVHAHGICQVVGSVLREIGYAEKLPPKDAYTQIYYGAKHLDRLIRQFKAKYKKMPTHDQMFATYNGGFGAATSDDFQSYVDAYVIKSNKNKGLFQ